jgi:hypothetical protein
MCFTESYACCILNSTAKLCCTGFATAVLFPRQYQEYVCTTVQSPNRVLELPSSAYFREFPIIWQEVFVWEFT